MEHFFHEFYLADGSGSCIEQSQFEVSSSDNKQEILPWSLSNYLKVSNIKFPFRYRLYCVMKTREDDGMYRLQFKAVVYISVRTCFVDGSGNPPPGYFYVHFVSKTKTLYTGQYSFRSGMSQTEILCDGLDSHNEGEMDIMLSARDTLEFSSSEFRVLEHNPLHLGFSLYSIEAGISLMSNPFC